MAILNDNTLPQPRPEPPKEQVLNRITNRIKNISRETFNQLVETQRQGISVLWENSNATPQEIIDALGEDAIKIFQFHGALTDFIKALSELENVEVELKLPTNSFLIDPKTGKITVSDEPYSPN